MKKLIRTLEESNKYGVPMGEMIDLPDPVRKGKKKKEEIQEVEE